MSGGSYDYAYARVENFAHELRATDNPLRRAFRSHLLLVAKAMHDIEWVDSCDYAPGDENEAIRAALGTNADAAQMAEIAVDLRRLVGEAEVLLARQAASHLLVVNPKEGTPA